MARHFGQTPSYAPGINRMTAKTWIVYMRTTLHLLERNMYEAGDIDKPLVSAMVEERTTHLDHDVLITLEVKD